MKQISIKVDVPDGFVLDKIETEGNNIVAFVKEKEEFKRGDVIALIDNNLYKDSIVILDEVAATGYWPINTIGGFTIKSSKININAAYNKYFLANSRLATPSEAQLLFDALAKEGKKWNAETIQIEDIEKDILVPESIGIYRQEQLFDADYDALRIAFNNDTQLLYYNYMNEIWAVSPLRSCYEKVQCKLTPCKRGDLRAGDTAFASIRNDYANLHNYCKIIDECIAYPLDLDIRVELWSNPKIKWYKVEPIN